MTELTLYAHQLASRKDVLEIELNENLRRRRDDLRSKIEQAEAARGGVAQDDEDDSGEDLEQRKRELKKLDQSITEIGQRLEGTSRMFPCSRVAPILTWSLCVDIDKESEKLAKEASELEKEREKRETQQSDDQRNIARQQKNVERYLAKRQILMQRRDECNKNIRDLGVLPEEAFIETTASSEKVRLLCSALKRAG